MAIEPGVPCSCNKHTREGRYNLDPDIKFFATPPHHGSLAQVRRHKQPSFGSLAAGSKHAACSVLMPTPLAGNRSSRQ